MCLSMRSSDTARVVALLLAALTAGCAVGPTFHRPDPPALTHYTAGTDPAQPAGAGVAAQRLAVGAPSGADWWRDFGSPDLTAIVSEALRANPGLEAAKASLRAADDELRSGYGIFYPLIAVNAAASRERYTGIAVDQPAGKVFNLFTAGASVSYALDLFGGQRRLVEELHAGVDLAQATEEATWLVLVSNVVNTTIARAAYSAEFTETSRLVHIRHEQLQIGEAGYQSGIVSAATLNADKTQLGDAEATLAQLAQRLAASTDLLAGLCGHSPAEWAPPEVPFADLTLPATLPVTLPSELVRTRPDILIAEATAHAASANIGVATANLFPSVALGGGVTAASHTVGQLFPADGHAWNVGATVNLPLFEGGSLWSRRKAAVAQYEQAMALYRQAVVTAFGQVADTLHALDHDDTQVQAEAAARDAAADTLRLVGIGASTGINSEADRLDAEAAYRNAQIAAIQASALRLQDSVALIAAMGGGWWQADHTGERAQ